MKKAVFFDLDGTLTDSYPGIANSIRYALDYFGFGEVGDDKMRLMVGPSLRHSFSVICGMDEWKVPTAIAKYREYYNPIGKFENSVYPGIPEVLGALRAHGFATMVATSKPEPFAREIIEHFGLAPYFDLVGGALLDGGRDTKEAVIRHVMGACGLAAGQSPESGDTPAKPRRQDSGEIYNAGGGSVHAGNGAQGALQGPEPGGGSQSGPGQATCEDPVGEPAEIWMVGDRNYDILGAKACGIKSLGVLYGYGTREELEEAGADAIAKTVADVGRFFLG
ncbi:MAG: HAD hydrolase-like protein [Lachnospiraceae bacterium]|nr:HAD hydrolase-like protein [Lachnospiraceae bacterium]